MSTSSIQGAPEKLDFEEIIERLSSLSGRLNEEMQSIGRANDQDQLKRSCDQIEGTKKIAVMMYQYFHKFEGELQKSLNFLESDAEGIINQTPRHQMRNPDLSHYVYNHVNDNFMKAESSIRLLHGEVSRRKSRAVCVRCEEEEYTRCQQEVSSEMSKQSDLREEIRRKLENLSETSRFLHKNVFELLLPFIVLPANTEVKRSLLENWWTGQDWVWWKPNIESLLKEFIENGIIDPVRKKGKNFKMDLLIHGSITSLAEEAEFFWRERNACLVQGKEFSYKNLNQLETLFNLNEQFPDLAVTAKQLSQMKRLRVLYLGSWETSTAEHDPIRHHIELEDITFLKAIENMKSLMWLSLRGISLISKLDVRKLTNLMILDLKSCWNLSELSDEFDSLKYLTHLDISGCYLLQRMPLSLATLSKLKVLKGFVISNQHNTCLLSQLARGLTKLSIKIVVVGFDIEGLFSELLMLPELHNLKIEWGTGAEVEHNRREWSQRGGRIYVEKLVLDGYPFEMLPSWIVPKCLGSLKELYIRGGNLITLGRVGKKWGRVEILRLKYMEDLEMDWEEEVGSLFPNLKYLERVGCPRVASWPCDTDGVWSSAFLCFD